MGIFKDRSNFFKNLAQKNKAIAHGVLVDGEARNSFHRMNDDEELQAGCVNFAHFPCMVHFGFDGGYSSQKNSLTRRKLSNGLLILAKVDDPMNMGQREDAYDLSFEILEQILAWMNYQWLTMDSCGPFTNFDLSRCSFSPVEINGNLFGWSMSFTDEVWADEVNNFDATKWFE
jgi:hypothetical protein